MNNTNPRCPVDGKRLRWLDDQWYCPKCRNEFGVEVDDPYSRFEAETTEQPEQDGTKIYPMPDRIAIDAKGYWWRCWDTAPEFWSMVPTNSDNTPIPEPIKFFSLTPLSEAEQMIAELQHQVLVARSHYEAAHMRAQKAMRVAAAMADDLAYYEAEDQRPGRLPSLQEYERFAATMEETP